MPSPNTTSTRTNLEMSEGRPGRKRRPTERIIENGDPLARKRARVISRSRTSASNTTDTVNEETAATVARRDPVGESRAPTTLHDARPATGHTSRMSNTADSADDGSNRSSPIPEANQPIEVSSNEEEVEEPENDITELSMSRAERRVHLFASH